MKKKRFQLNLKVIFNRDVAKDIEPNVAESLVWSDVLTESAYIGYEIEADEVECVEMNNEFNEKLHGISLDEVSIDGIADANKYVKTTRIASRRPETDWEKQKPGF